MQIYDNFRPFPQINDRTDNLPPRKPCERNLLPRLHARRSDGIEQGDDLLAVQLDFTGPETLDLQKVVGTLHSAFRHGEQHAVSGYHIGIVTQIPARSLRQSLSAS